MHPVNTPFLKRAQVKLRFRALSPLPLLPLLAARAYAQQAGGSPWENAVNVLKTAFYRTDRDRIVAGRHCRGRTDVRLR